MDGTGRRRRIAAIAGSAAGLALLLAAVTMVAALTGVGGAHLPGLPGPGGGPGAAPGQSAVPAPTSRTREPQIPAAVRSGGAPTAPGGGASAVPSPSLSSHRNVPTQTPSHPGKK